MPIPALLGEAGIAVGASVLGSLFEPRRNRPSNFTNSFRQPFGETQAGQELYGELDGFEEDTQAGFGRFQRLASAGAPTIGDLLGASYAQGGRGILGRQQAAASQQAARGAAFQGYSQFRQQRSQQRQQLLSVIAGAEGNYGQQQLQAGQLAGSQYQYDRNNSVGRLLGGAGAGALGQIGQHYFNSRFGQDPEGSQGADSFRPGGGNYFAPPSSGFGFQRGAPLSLLGVQTNAQFRGRQNYPDYGNQYI